jgi:uncharacterized protein YsxB (DUF464 family)
MNKNQKAVKGEGNAPRGSKENPIVCQSHASYIMEFANELNKPHNMIKIDQQFAAVIVRSLNNASHEYNLNGKASLCQQMRDLADDLQRQINNQL